MCTTLFFLHLYTTLYIGRDVHCTYMATSDLVIRRTKCAKTFFFLWKLVLLWITHKSRLTTISRVSTLAPCQFRRHLHFLALPASNPTKSLIRLALNRALLYQNLAYNIIVSRYCKPKGCASHFQAMEVTCILWHIIKFKPFLFFQSVVLTKTYKLQLMIYL
jgi:hypothetical protein